MLATVKRYGTGKCLISGTEGEGVEVEFADGSIRGFLTLKEFTKLLKARASGANGSAERSPFDQQAQ